ncbi:hypothetical protein [Halorubrum cibi]|nr:hypothetical protein [Halorubrum cibi]
MNDVAEFIDGEVEAIDGEAPNPALGERQVDVWFVLVESAVLNRC